MDPITHGISGCLLGKGYFSEKYGRTALWAVAIGSVFPDIDVVMEVFSHDPLAVVRYHRGFTHSFIGLPLFAAALALLTMLWERRRGRKGTSFGILFSAYTVGIASHIFLDWTTSYGTRLWNPISSHRYSLDWLFIIDFTLTAMLLLPQVSAWAYRREGGAARRALVMWILFALATLGVWRIAEAAGAGFGWGTVAIIVALLAGIFFLPLWRGMGWRVPRGKWCRAGVYVTVAYIFTAGTAHHIALERVRGFADARNLAVVHEAAIPLPASLLHWDGMILTSDGVYHSRFSLADSEASPFEFLADHYSESILAQARKFSDVGTYLWFARFPIIRTYQENGDNVVEFSDVRFLMRRRKERPPFTFRVVMDPQGRLVEEDWAVGARGIRFHRRKFASPPASVATP